MQSFHPSCAVNNARRRPEYKALLINHFVAAFSELKGTFVLPDSAEKLRELCLIRGERRYVQPFSKNWEAASSISRALRDPYNGPSNLVFIRRTHDTPWESRTRQIEAFTAMFESLNQLSKNSKQFDALGIAKALFLWKQYFWHDLLYKQVKSWLRIGGNSQEDWFSSLVHRPPIHRPLEEQLSEATIVGSCIISHIRRFNMDATTLAV